MGRNGMACLGDLRDRYPRDGDALLVRPLHVALLYPIHNLSTFRYWSGNVRSSANDELLDSASCTSSIGSQTKAFSAMPLLDCCLRRRWIWTPSANFCVSPTCIDDHVCRATAMAMVSGLEAPGSVHGRWRVCIAHIGCEATSRRLACCNFS